MLKQKFNYTLILFVSGIFFALLYLGFRILIVVIANYCWIEKIVAILLLLSELFVLIHGIGYIFEILKITKQSNLPEDKLIDAKPEVAIVIPSYHEPLEILEKTITTCFNLSYFPKTIFLLDDTRYEEGNLDQYKAEIEKMCQRWNVSLFRRKWRGAKAGILNDFLSYLSNQPKEGSSCQFWEEKKRRGEFKYFAVFDADQNPFVNFLEPLVSLLEKNPKLAFVQTPQYYTNIDKNRIAKAASMQQAVFYEFISEGKSCSDVMFSCGTNVLYRLEALHDVKGFEEGSVTEDFATSLKFHLHKWSTLYYNKVGVFGMGPENLMAYFKQQYRWAFGTITLMKEIVWQVLTNPRQLNFAKWWEYFLSGTYYFIGFVLFIFIICPLLYLFFNIPTYFVDFKIYGIIFLPYFLLALFIYFGTLRNRGYSVLELIFGQVLLYQCFFVYMRAAIGAFIGKKMKFEVTLKGQEQSLSLYKLWPQILLGFLCLVAFVWGINRMVFEKRDYLSTGLNVFWCLYNFVILSFVFYFNNPKGKQNEV